MEGKGLQGEDISEQDVRVEGFKTVTNTLFIDM